MTNVVRAAGLLIYKKVNSVPQYLLLQSSVQPYHWTPPKGHVDPGEDEWAAALRETQEEAGLDAKELEIYKEFCHVMNYEANKHPKQVTYWLAQLKNDGFDVKISMEHQKFAWVDLSEAIGLAKYPEIEKMLIAADEFITKNLS